MNRLDRNVAMCVLLLFGVCAHPLLAGPNRASRVTSTPSGGENLLPGGQQGAPLNEGVDNYCSVTIGPDKKTWVLGEGKIVIVPTTVSYTKNYELFGYDHIRRVAEISGCEVGHWDYSATCALWLSTSAGRGPSETGDVKAVSFGSLRVWQDGTQVGFDVRECTSSNIAGPRDGAYNVPTGDGVLHIGAGFWNVAVGENAGLASNVCAVKVERLVGLKSFTLEYRDYCWLTMKTAVARGHAKARAEHKTADAQTGKRDTWQVVMHSWDDDDPNNAVHIQKHLFDGDVDQ